MMVPYLIRTRHKLGRKSTWFIVTKIHTGAGKKAEEVLNFSGIICSTRNPDNKQNSKSGIAEISAADPDPGSSVYLTSWIRDEKKPDPRSGINISDIFTRASSGIIFELKILKFFVNSVLRIRIRDGKIQIGKHPGSTTLADCKVKDKEIKIKK
jgi:hypothetical protein